MCNSKKKCSKCKEEKDLSEFHNDKRNKDGKTCYCKSCCLDRTRKRNNTDPKKYRISQKERKELFEKGLKRCGFCKEEKDLCEFNNDKRNKDGKRNECKSCRLEYERKRDGVSPENYKSVRESKKKELFDKGLKECSKCKEIKDLNEFGDNKLYKDGKKSNCKSCEAKQRRKRNNIDPKNYQLTNKERKELFDKGLKKCSCCKETKQLCDFADNKHQRYGKMPWCRICELDKRRKYNNVDPENYQLTNKERKELFDKGLKKCNCCKETKELYEFHKDNRQKNGRDSNCKSCVLEKQREVNGVRPENKRITHKERKELISNGFNYCQSCKEIHTIDSFTKCKRRGIGGYCKKCRSKKRVEGKEVRNEYQKNRQEKDTLFKIIIDIRRSLLVAFKRQGYTKDSETQKILGCSFEDFKKHIEDQFEPWMNWENHGKRIISERNVSWDYDHIIPISSATTEEEVIKLNHYTNFQPLCSYVNRYIKKDKLDFELV